MIVKSNVGAIGTLDRRLFFSLKITSLIQTKMTLKCQDKIMSITEAQPEFERGWGPNQKKGHKLITYYFYFYFYIFNVLQTFVFFLSATVNIRIVQIS